MKEMSTKVWHGKGALHSQKKILDYYFQKNRLDYGGGGTVRRGSRLSASSEMKDRALGDT